ncbi:MAG: hypothetical protein KAI24_08875, partial [Planctomycetes bacterium]|nr:hypothetical protein [Planctomycetota bacterium]
MQIRTTILVPALLATSFLISPLLRAQGESADAGSMAAIEKAYEEANSKWLASYREAAGSGASKEEIQKLMAQRPTAE